MLQMQTDRAVDITTEEKVEDENTNTFIMGRPDPTDAIAHIFELLTAEKTIRYIHATTGFPVEATWMGAVHAGNYATWPGLSIKAVNKYHSEADETHRDI